MNLRSRHPRAATAQSTGKASEPTCPDSEGDEDDSDEMSPPSSSSTNTKLPPSDPYKAWFESRNVTPNSSPQREFTWTNILLAIRIIRTCFFHLISILWGSHPGRTVLLVFLNTFRGVLPAFKGYSQSLILDEIQVLLSSSKPNPSRLGRLILADAFRMLVESVFDAFATHNENLVQQSAQYHIEYLQMQTRLHLDIPTLSDPTVRELLQESDMFVRSFSGMGIGLLSPFDIIRILTTLSELVSQSFILWSLSASARSGDTTRGVQAMIIAFAVLPTVISSFRLCIPAFLIPGDSWSHSLYTPEEVLLFETQERMKGLAWSENHKPEIMLFGLKDWILHHWSLSRRTLLGLQSHSIAGPFGAAVSMFARCSAAEIFSLLQTIPMVLQFSSTSLGSVTLYRTTVETLVSTVLGLSTSLRMSFQSIFLMGAFHASLTLKPVLRPSEKGELSYQTMEGPNGRRGMKVDIRNLSFTYPGKQERTLHNVNFAAQPGETIAIVGLNGSGKSTFVNVLLRLFEFDSGELLINGQDVRRYSNLQNHMTAVLQPFSRFTNATLRENTGVGQVSLIDCDAAITDALEAGGAGKLLHTLPEGLQTKLDYTGGYDSPYHDPLYSSPRDTERRSLSGGEWQKVAIARAFMRTTADLCVFDEASSSLDAKAQNDLFDRIVAGSLSPSGKKVKTVIFVTHRLSTVRRADKVAYFEGGTITEFGTHDDLLRRGGSYASLYRAFSAV